MNIVEFFSSIFEYDFLAKALVTSIAVGLASGIIGSFVILRGLSLMGDAISHAVLPGIAVAFMLDVNFFIGALFAGLIAAYGMGLVSSKTTLKRDTSIGVVFTAFLAFGIILLSYTTSAVSLQDILFGNVLAVRTSDIWTTVIIGAVVVSLILVFYQPLKISTFDPVLAASYGIPTTLIHFGLMLGLTLVTVASVQTVGVVLVVALLISPAATAYLLSRKLSTMILIASLIGTVSAVLGMYFSFTFNLVSGPSIVLTAFGFFVLAFLFSPTQGVVTRAFIRPATPSAVDAETEERTLADEVADTNR